ncbi:MAG: hypothetical protein OK455_09630, partial [Thaumarchaeota archaeon]|nr:hypothetical protein [Nitrososphaerota archaeon]
AAAEPIAPENPVQEIREVQSQLAEINSQALEAHGADAAIATAIPAVAGPQTETPGFAFSSGVAVRTSEELVLALEKVPTDVLEFAVKSGDLERWFADALFDASTAESLKKIRESGVFGDELRSQVASSLEKYLPAPNPVPQQAPTTT